MLASWIALFAIQTSLVTMRRLDLHSKLGVFGALAGLVFIMAYAVMFGGLHWGFGFAAQDEARIPALELIGINVSFGMF